MFAIDYKISTTNISNLFPVPPPKLQHWRRQIDAEETVSGEKRIKSYSKVHALFPHCGYLNDEIICKLRWMIT